MSQNCSSYTTTGCGCQAEAPAACAGACPPPCMPVCPYPPFPCPPPRPRPDCVEQVRPAEVNCGCPCAAGLVAALQLLCDARFAPLVDYTKFAFFTDYFALGTSLSCPAVSAAAYDNLTGPLDAGFVRITPNSCERLEVSGQLYYPIPVCTGGGQTPCCVEGPAFSAREVSLCSLRAVAFDMADAEEPELQQANYARLKALFYQATHPGCSETPDTPAKATPCDAQNSLGTRGAASLTAGALLIGNAQILGSIGDVVILANDVSRRFYYVCQSAVDFLS